MVLEPGPMWECSTWCWSLDPCRSVVHGAVSRTYEKYSTGCWSQKSSTVQCRGSNPETQKQSREGYPAAPWIPRARHQPSPRSTPGTRPAPDQPITAVLTPKSP